jgi:cytochrome c553
MKIFTLGIAVMALSLTNVAVAADAAAGEEKSAACVACHGADGVATAPLTPSLNGQKEDYLVLSTKAYRDGERNNDMMKMFVMSLTDEDIANLAAYYSGL